MPCRYFDFWGRIKSTCLQYRLLFHNNLVFSTLYCDDRHICGRSRRLRLMYHLYINKFFVRVYVTKVLLNGWTNFNGFLFFFYNITYKLNIWEPYFATYRPSAVCYHHGRQVGQLAPSWYWSVDFSSPNGWRYKSFPPTTHPLLLF